MDFTFWQAANNQKNILPQIRRLAGWPGWVGKSFMYFFLKVSAFPFCINTLHKSYNFFEKYMCVRAYKVLSFDFIFRQSLRMEFSNIWGCLLGKGNLREFNSISRKIKSPYHPFLKKKDLHVPVCRIRRFKYDWSIYDVRFYCKRRMSICTQYSTANRVLLGRCINQQRYLLLYLKKIETDLKPVSTIP